VFLWYKKLKENLKKRVVNVGDIRFWECSVGRMLLEMDSLLINWQGIVLKKIEKVGELSQK